MKKIIFIIVIFLLGIYSLYSQDLITNRIRYTVNSVSGKVEFQHPNVSNLWIKVTQGNNFNQDIRIRVPSNASLILSDVDNNIFEIKQSLEGRISSLIIGENDEEALAKRRLSSIDSDKMFFGINANAGGVIPLGNTLDPSGPSLNFEFIKNNFYSIVNVNLPIQNNTVGFGFSGIFNYLWKSKIGEFYLGGGLGYTYQDNHFLTFGANAGYRFITSFVMFFNAGGYIGGKINDAFTLDIRPVLGAGYLFK